MKGKHKKSQNRREQIIQAGLFCFTKNGFTETTMAEICRESNASTGSVYHHYKSKEQLAGAVYLEGIISFQDGFTEMLSGNDTAFEGIKKSISFYITWVKDNPDWAKFLFYQRHSDFMQKPNEELEKRNSDFIRKISVWFKKHIKDGNIKDMEWDVYMPVLVGPCQDYTKYYLAGISKTPVDEAIELLAASAWDAVKKV